MRHVLIIGNGPATHRLVERLRHYGQDGPITVLGAEREPAYNRALLGSVLDGTLAPQALTLPTLTADVRLGVTATRIDTAQRLVRTDTGAVHRYDELVLATGSRPVPPDVPGLYHDGRPAGGATTLRTLDDSTRLAASTSVIVLGGGVLGVETACGLARRGVHVTLVHPHAQLMNRYLDATACQLLADHLHRLGVVLRLGRTAAQHRPGELVLDDGETLRAAAIAVCTGVVPESTLALSAGLLIRRGVVVDDGLHTSDPHIHAIGDCAEHNGQIPGHITPAWEQADTLARRLTGTDARYPGNRTIIRLKARGIDLAIVGTPAPPPGHGSDTERVTLSDPARGRYATLALRNHQVDSAVLLGFPQAIASITQLHNRGAAFPSDRLAFLLGRTASTQRADLPGTAVLCHCNNVTKQTLVSAWHNGARGVRDLSRATHATTGCGTCADDIQRLCDSLRASSDTPTMTEQEGAG